MLTSLDWWRKSLAAAMTVAPTFVLPAALMTVSNVISVVALDKLQKLVQGQDLTVEALSASVAPTTLAIVVALALTFWSLGIWLMGLTAVARCRLGSVTLNPKNLQKAKAELAPKKGYMSRVWLIASLYMLLPICLLSALMSARIMFNPAISGFQSLDLAIPAWMPPLVNLSIFFLGAVLGGFTLLVLCLSSKAQPDAGTISREVSLIWLRRWKVLLPVSAFILILDTVIGTPAVFINLISGYGLETAPIWLQIAAQVWLGVSSTVLWPLTVLPYCEMISQEAAAST